MTRFVPFAALVGIVLLGAPVVAQENATTPSSPNPTAPNGAASSRSESGTPGSAAPSQPVAPPAAVAPAAPPATTTPPPTVAEPLRPPAGISPPTENGRYSFFQVRDHFMRLDTRTGRVAVDGNPVKLTSHEYRLLSYLMHHAGRVVSRTELVEHLYDQDFDRDSNTIEVFVGRIRKKLGVDIIQTVRGLGYLLTPPDAH